MEGFWQLLFRIAKNQVLFLTVPFRMERLYKISIASEHPLSLGNFLNLAEIGEKNLS